VFVCGFCPILRLLIIRTVILVLLTLLICLMDRSWGAAMVTLLVALVSA
jgi:hypothetical protein